MPVRKGDQGTVVHKHQVVLVHKIRPLGSESRSLKMYELYCRNSDNVLTVATMSASVSTTNTELRNSTYLPSLDTVYREGNAEDHL